jgi:hypothetical protein
MFASNSRGENQIAGADTSLSFPRFDSCIRALSVSLSLSLCLSRFARALFVARLCIGVVDSFGNIIEQGIKDHVLSNVAVTVMSPGASSSRADADSPIPDVKWTTVRAFLLCVLLHPSDAATMQNWTDKEAVFADVAVALGSKGCY